MTTGDLHFPRRKSTPRNGVKLSELSLWVRLVWRKRRWIFRKEHRGMLIRMLFRIVSGRRALLLLLLRAFVKIPASVFWAAAALESRINTRLANEP